MLRDGGLEHHGRVDGAPLRIVGRRCSDRSVTLKQAVEDPGSPLRQFLDSQLPHTKDVRAAWKRQPPPDIDLSPPKDAFTAGVEGVQRYPHDEVGHATSIRLTLLFSPEVGAAITPPRRHPVSGLPWTTAGAFYPAFQEAASAGFGFTAWSSAREETLIRLCYVAGLFDQLFRIGARPGMPLLEVPRDASLEDLLCCLVNAACVADLVAIVGAARLALAPLSASTPVVVAPTFSGSADVGSAEADLLLGSTLLEIKARGRYELQQRHLHQIVSYSLLDYDDEHGIRDLAVYSARHGALVRWSMQELLDVMAGRSVDVQLLRQDLKAALRI